MRRIVSALGLTAVLLAAACSQSTEPTGKGSDRSVGTLSGGSCVVKTASEIEANLTLLMNYVVPNDNSTLGKFQGVKDAVAAGDYALAQTKLDNLINFINNKFGQLSTGEKSQVMTEPAAGGMTVAQFKDMVIADLICFISFDLNPGDPAKVFVTPDGMAGVWFPANYVPVGTNVEISNITGNYPAGTSPLVTPFDKYPTYVEIKLVPQPATFTGTAVVVVCFPSTTPASVASRLLLGHQTGPADPALFELYESVPVPAELASALQCQAGLNVAYTGAEKWLRKAADFFLPPRLHAAFFGAGGVGGSPEEFSPFGAVDPRLTALGGAGGSPEEFQKATPPASTSAKPAPAQSSVILQSSHTTGQVGTTATTGLPSVTVQTAGLDGDVNPVPGVTVTFTLGPAATFNPDGDAHFCGAFPPSSVVVTTDINGVAALPCIDFGIIAGYSNLKATVDGSSLGYTGSQQNSLVVIVSQGATVPPFNEVNFLIQATAGPGAKFTLHQAAASSAQAGATFSPQPTLQLRDANDNPVPQAGVPITAALAGGVGTLAGDLVVETDATGLATFTDLRIDGLIGTRTLSFTSAHPTVPGGTVVITAGPAARLGMVIEPAGATAGQAFTTQPSVRLEDAFGNAVSTSGVTVTAVLGGGGALVGNTDVNTVGGVATFTDLRIDGVVGPKTLAFSATGLTGVSSASFALAPGAAAALLITTQPSATATAGVAWAQQPVVALRDAWGNAVTTPQLSVTASITTGGAGTLAGTLALVTVNGVATFSDLRIDGVVGTRTLTFSAGALTPATSSAINVSAGTASVIRTFMPTSAPVAAATYSYGTGLPVGPVADPPQVLVTDAFGNGVGGVGVSWTPLTGSNGATLVVGTGGATTTAAGLAQVTSWTLADGANQILAEITGGAAAAQFSGTGPSGQSLFACTLGGSKADVGWMTIKTPNGTVRTITLWISVTGQSSTVATYPATITLLKNGSTGAVVGSGAGGVTLPGNNGTATLVTFTLSDPAFQSETSGAGSQNVLWIDLRFPNLLATRKMQVWYQNVRRPAGACADSRIYAPGSTTSSKPGLSIAITN